MSTTFDRIMQKANADLGDNPQGGMYDRIIQKSYAPPIETRYDITTPAKAANNSIYDWSDLNAVAEPIVKPVQPAKTDIFDKTFKIGQPSAQQTANYNRLQEIVAKSNPIQTNTQILASGRDFAVMPSVETGGRIGAGLKSIGQSAKAALPMLGSTAAQAAENVAAAADSKDYAAKRAQLFMLQNGLSNIPEYDKRKAAEEEAKTALQNVVNAEQLNKPVSPDSVGMQMMGKAKEYQRQAVEGLSPTGQFIGNTLISVGQNAAMLPSAAINPAAPLIGMGAIAAADKAYELSEQGVGAGEALTRGFAAGGIEALTEKIPLENLLKMAKTPAGESILKTLIKQSGKQAAGESVEEAVSYALNYAADALARDPNAKFSWQDLGMAALGGAVSGGIMGGGATAFGNYVYNNSQPVTRVQDGVQTENPAQPETAQGEKTATFWNYWNQIVDTIKGKMNIGDVVTVGDTPELLRQHGANPIPITLNQSEVRKIAYPQGYMGGKHNLGFYALEILPQQLADPVAILKSSTQPNSFVIFTELLDAEQRPVMVAMHLDKEGRLGVSNQIASMYGRKNFESFIQNERAAGNVLYENKEKDLSWLPAFGLQLPKVDAKSDPINANITQTNIAVNEDNSQPAVNDVQTLSDRINEDIRSKMAANRSQMQQLTEQRKQLREAQRLKRESYSTLDNAELMQRIADIRKATGTDQADALRKFAGDIVYSAQVKDSSFAEQYNEARQLIKNTRFKLAAQDRADLGTDYKTFANSNRGKIKLSDNGTPVDSVYMELNGIAPNMFPEDITHPADQLKQISYFMETTAPDFVNPYSEDTESGVSYIEDKLRGMVGLNEQDNYDVPPVGLSAEEYQQVQADEDAEISRDLNERLDQIIKDYESEMFEEIEKLRKADPGVREAINNMIVEGEGISEGADLSEIAGLLQNGFFYNTDIGRALDKTARAGRRGELKLSKEAAKKVRDALHEAIEKPLEEAKAGYTNAVTDQINRTADIFKRLGIKPGSKESAAVQWIGEGQRQNGTELEAYTETDLRRDFPEKWKDILEGAQAARQIYDEYIDKVNAVRLQMYPEIETRALNEITRLNAKAQAYYANAQAQEQYIAQKRADLAQVQSQIKEGNVLTQSQLARQRQVLALNNTIMAAEQKRSAQLEKAKNYEARASEVQRQIDSGEILRQKRLMPRKDYFHHFTEMAEGFGGLMNILNTPSDISSALAGVSEFTKPKAKFWGALEQRKGGAYTEDAVGGLAKYIPAAEYAVHIDPFIAHMRGTVKNLAIATADTRNANSLITYLTDWTNDLAGKTNKFDRAIMDAMPDRRFMQALNWVNNRVKANAVVGNLSSAVVQIGNIPNAMTYVPNMQRWSEAIAKLATGNGNLEESKFLKERYLGETLDRLNNKGIVRKGAENLLEFGDRQAAKVIWQAAYEQYNKGGARRGTRSYENAADYADDITRRSIAGRGIGELPLTQKSKLIGMVSPFMVEVNNTYHVVKDAIGERDAAAVITYAIAANLINALMQSIRGNRPLFDPLDAAWDALKTLVGNEDAEWIWDLLEGKDEEEERGAVRRTTDAAMRLVGEGFANMPYAQAAATLMGSENSEKIFGENDPTRYGTGNIGVSTIAEPLADFAAGRNVDYIGALASILPAYGGKQIERTIKGAQSLGYLPRVDVNSSGIETGKNQFGASRSASGQIRFPITTPADQVKNALFGEWSTSRGKDYINEGRSPMSDKQTKAMEDIFAAGISPDIYYDAYLASKKAQSQKDAKGKTIPLSQDKDKVKLVKQAVPGLSAKEYKLIFEALGISKNAY